MNIAPAGLAGVAVSKAAEACRAIAYPAGLARNFALQPAQQK